MPVRMKGAERGADFMVRKDRDEYRIFPISGEALRWLKAHSPHARWGTIHGRNTVIAARADAARLLREMRRNDFQVHGDLDKDNDRRLGAEPGKRSAVRRHGGVLRFVRFLQRRNRKGPQDVAPQVR